MINQPDFLPRNLPEDHPLPRVCSQHGIYYALTKDCPQCQLIDSLQSRIKELEDIATLAKNVIDDIKTVNVDMGGKHRYALRHDAYKSVEPLRVALKEKP